MRKRSKSSKKSSKVSRRVSRRIKGSRRIKVSRKSRRSFGRHQTAPPGTYYSDGMLLSNSAFQYLNSPLQRALMA
jgi:hypothetical protein